MTSVGAYILCDISPSLVFLCHCPVVFDLFFDLFQVVGNLDETKVSEIFCNCFQWWMEPRCGCGHSVLPQRDFQKNLISFSLIGMRRWVLNGISGQVVFLKMDLHCFPRRFPILLCSAFQYFFLGLMLHQPYTRDLSSLNGHRN